MDATGPVKRRLTAILAADAVGYSARMAENEERALRTLQGHRRLIDSLIADHGGRIVGTAGDSVLAEFGSSVEAVRCAVEIQEALATRNDSLAAPERMQFRIGINLGDVIVDGADILGDGVNVASRLESIADPGGICIASSVFDQISGKLNLGFEDIGERSLKNIGRPVRAYRLPARCSATPGWQFAADGDRIRCRRRGPRLSAPARSARRTNGHDTAPPLPRSRKPAVSPGTETAPPVAPQTAPVATPSPRLAGTAAIHASRGRAGAATGRAPEPDVNGGLYDGNGTGPMRTAGRQARSDRARPGAGCRRRSHHRGGHGGSTGQRGPPRKARRGRHARAQRVHHAGSGGCGAKVAARYEGNLNNGRAMLKGNQGALRCSLGLMLK
jgi:class 3 adenylate cyclase